MQSQDLEILKLTVKELQPLLDDIVFVGGSTISDGRASIADDLKAANADVLKYLRVEFSNFISGGDFESAIEAHISDRQNTLARKHIVMERVKSISE